MRIQNRKPGTMRNTCPHCQTTFKTPLYGAFFEEQQGPLGSPTARPRSYAHNGEVMRTMEKTAEGDEVSYQLFAFGCFKCHQVTVEVQRHVKIPGGEHGDAYTNTQVIPIQPLGGERAAPPEVPEHIAQDYREATRCTSLSSKASATLARRCLQALIRDIYRPKGMPKLKRLVDEIEWVEKNSDIIDEIKGALHSLRLAGNFGAHPDQNEDDEVVLYDLPSDVLDGCFTLLEELFQIHYVQPKQRSQRIEKLTAAFPHQRDKTKTD
jgi:hypothetical protein